MRRQHAAVVAWVCWPFSTLRESRGCETGEGEGYGDGPHPFSTLRESRGCETATGSGKSSRPANLSVLSASRGGVRLVAFPQGEYDDQAFSTLRESRGCETVDRHTTQTCLNVHFQYSPRVEGV